MSDILFSLNESGRASSDRVLVAWQTNRDKVACSEGDQNELINLYEKNGKLVDSIAVPNGRSVVAMEWDCLGNSLAFLQAGGDEVLVYNLETRAINSVHVTGMKASWLKWNKRGPHLAIGCQSGLVSLFDRDENALKSFSWCHYRPIVCGSWSFCGRFIALGSKDRTVTIYKSDGAQLAVINLKSVAKQIAFAPVTAADETGSCNLAVMTQSKRVVTYLDGSTLDLKKRDMSDDFDVIHLGWLSKKLLVLGLESGTIVKADLSCPETSFQRIDIVNTLCRLVLCPEKRNYGAVCDQEGTVICIDLATSKVMTQFHHKVVNLAWKDDGTAISMVLETGRIIHYDLLSRSIPCMPAVFHDLVAFRSQPFEISVIAFSQPLNVVIKSEFDPEALFLGSSKISYSFKNCLYVYELAFQNANQESSDTSPLWNHEFRKPIEKVLFTEVSCFVLSHGKIYEIRDEQGSVKSRKLETEAKVRDIALALEYLVYGTLLGEIFCARVSDLSKSQRCILKHSQAIRRIYPQEFGTRLVFTDNSSNVYFYRLGDQIATEIPSLTPSGATSVSFLWDRVDYNVFAAVVNGFIHTYAYFPAALSAPKISKLACLTISEAGDVSFDTEVDPFEMPFGHTPIALFGGIIICQMADSFTLTSLVLSSHKHIHSLQSKPQEKLQELLALGKLEQAWHQALQIDSRKCWLAVGMTALQNHMNLELAVQAWQHLGDVAMAEGESSLIFHGGGRPNKIFLAAIERLIYIESIASVSGHLAKLFGHYDYAEQQFLQSPDPWQALAMRKRLMHWDHAYSLAKTLAPKETFLIALMLAREAENDENFPKALELYEEALAGVPHLDAIDVGDVLLSWKQQLLQSADAEDDVKGAVKQLCMTGIARCNLGVGNIPKGVAKAMEIDTQSIYRSCAEILVKMKQFEHAVKLYKLAKLEADAASVYILMNRLDAAYCLLKPMTSTCLHRRKLARILEMNKEYQRAAELYKLEGDGESFCRVALQNSQDDQVLGYIRDTRNQKAALLASKYFLDKMETRTAAELLLIADKFDKAIQIATRSSDVIELGDLIGDIGTKLQYQQIAQYYESRNMFSKAADFYWKASEKSRSLRLFVHAGNLDQALKLVEDASSKTLTQTLIELLLQQSGTNLRQLESLSKLYILIGNVSQAVETALTLSRNKCNKGDLTGAHTSLFDSVNRFVESGIPIPENLYNEFSIVHSFVLANVKMKNGEHACAARLLSRVAANICLFPLNSAHILCKAAQECHHSGFRRSALIYARALLAPDQQKLISQEQKRIAESIVRHRAQNNEDSEDEMTQCPCCSKPFASYELICPRTKKQLWFCIISGKHMTLSDWCICPRTNLPALYSEYVAYLDKIELPEDRIDPILKLRVSADQLQRILDPQPWIVLLGSENRQA